MDDDPSGWLAVLVERAGWVKEIDRVPPPFDSESTWGIFCDMASDMSSIGFPVNAMEEKQALEEVRLLSGVLQGEAHLCAGRLNPGLSRVVKHEAASGAG